MGWTEAYWGRRVGLLSLGGLLVGLSLAACPGPPGSESACTSLCQSAYACGVIPSALGNGISSMDEDTVVNSCIERCRSSDPARNDVAKVTSCLSLYQPTDSVDVCAPECSKVVACMRSAVSTGDIGAESLGTSNVTVTMVPADLWLSTKENATWCPEGIGEVPRLREYYGNDEILTPVTEILVKVGASYQALLTGLDMAADDQGRLAVLDEMETGLFNGELLLPGDLVPRLRAELEAGGWSTPSVVDGDLVPGGCIRQLIDDTRDSLLEGVNTDDPESVRARLEEEVEGEGAFEVFSSGFSVCQQNSDYIGVTGAKQCQQSLGGDSDKCRVFGKPMCSVGDCDGGLAGCDPLMCFFEQLPPSRACSDLGIDEVYLGYERDGSKFIDQDPQTCDGTVIKTVFPEVAVSVVTPFAVVRGRLKSLGDIPGRELLRCGVADEAPPQPEAPPELAAGAAPPLPGVARASATDPFDDPEPGEYCWVVHGEPTQVVAGDRDLVVPSPFVEFLREAIKPGSRFGLLAPQLPIGCACELDPGRCENLANGNCRDGKDNDGDGLADYYAPECAGYVDTLPYYEVPDEVDASDIDRCLESSD